jgi:hypothetical protein
MTMSQLTDDAFAPLDQARVDPAQPFGLPRSTMEKATQVAAKRQSELTFAL